MGSDAGAVAALAWLVAAGVDCALEATPRRWLDAAPPWRPAATPDRVAPPWQPAASPDRVAPRAPMARAAIAPAAASTATRLTAATLGDLDAALAAFDHPLHRRDLAPQLLAGNAHARIIILCDQIEAEASPAAVLRTRMLAAIGLDAGNSALLHRIPWPMPGGRSPTNAELASFAPFVACAMSLVRPRAVLALGQLAAALAGEAMARASARGRWADIFVGDAAVPLAVPLLATCHPRLLLGQPARKREAWADLQAFAARLAVTA